MDFFRILIVKNRLKVNIADDLEKVKDYEEANTPFVISYGYRTTDLDLSHKVFAQSFRDNQLTPIYGLDGVKEKLRKVLPIPSGLYHAVVFMYDLDDTKWFDLHGGESIGHWTYFNEIMPGTEFIEVATTEAWDAVDDIYRVLTHELRHAYANRLKRQGIPFSDPMDMTPVQIDCNTKQPKEDGMCSMNIPYYGEFNINQPDGNRATANKLLAPYWKKVVEHKEASMMLDILNALMNAFKVVIALTQRKQSQEKEDVPVVPEKPRPDRVALMADAIQKYEGWYVGSRSYRNNNPGNLRSSKYQIGTDGGFAVFKDYDTGRKALVHQIEMAIYGTSKVYYPHDTILSFFKKYAPSSDNNYPVKYAQFVADYIGVSVDTPMSALL